MLKGLNDLCTSVYEDNKRKGFWPEDHKVGQAGRNTGEALMLMTSELAEALEADRNGQYVRPGHPLQALAIMGTDNEIDGMKFKEFFLANVKDTFEDELADCVIRILDYCGAQGVDLESHILTKLAYNRTRASKHGKAY